VKFPGWAAFLTTFRSEAAIGGIPHDFRDRRERRHSRHSVELSDRAKVMRGAA